MKRNKGLVYSFIALLLVLPSILLIIAYFNTFRVEGENYVSKVRAENMKNFYSSLIADVKRSLKISTFRAILYATQNITESGKPLTNVDEKIAEMIHKGTLDGIDVPSLTSEPCNTVNCWKENYTALANSLGYNLNIKILSISIKPYDSWNINSSITMEIELKDENMKMRIKRNVTESSIVPITGFEDPLYVLNTYGKVINLVKKPKTPLTRAESGYGWALGILTDDPNSGDHNKILLVDDLSSVTPQQLEKFGGVLFKKSVSNNIPIPYLNKIEDADALELGMRVFFENITNSVWKLQDEIDSSTYHESYFGPSYLDRLEGRFSISDKYKSPPRPTGLMSFVDFYQLEEKGIKVDWGLSCVDYLYFNGKADGLCYTR
ncbi:MAG: hypothetical protein QXL86_00360 [Candidatus Aenigmatarchaeota archaeon]